MNIKGLNKWLKKYDFDCDCKMGNPEDDFQYAPAEETIYCGELADNCEDGFTKFAKHLGLKNMTDIRAIAFLHELGHYNTYDDLDDTLIKWNEIIKILIYRTPTPNQFIADIKYNIYWRLGMEKVATLWAIDFANENPDAVQELEELCV